MFIPDRELMPILRAALERGQRVRMTVNGRSMFPFIEDGDVVEIAPVPPALALGTVVLAHLSDGLYPLHRLVARSGAAWVLRGDNRGAPDGVVPRENLLGVVTQVKRNGRVVSVGLGRAGRWIGWLSAQGWLLPITRGLYFPQRVARATLRLLQRLPVYRQCAKRFRPDYVVQAATVGDLITVSTWLYPTGERTHAWVEQNTAPNVTSYVAKRGESIVGFVRLIRSPASEKARAGYWLYTLHVSLRFRGMGFGAALTQRVIQQARSEGAAELLLYVVEDNLPALALYRMLGFEPVTLQGLEAPRPPGGEHPGHRMLAMRKSLA